MSGGTRKALGSHWQGRSLLQVRGEVVPQHGMRKRGSHHGFALGCLQTTRLPPLGVFGGLSLHEHHGNVLSRLCREVIQGR